MNVFITLMYTNLGNLIHTCNYSLSTYIQKSKQERVCFECRVLHFNIASTCIWTVHSDIHRHRIHFNFGGYKLVGVILAPVTFTPDRKYWRVLMAMTYIYGISSILTGGTIMFLKEQKELHILHCRISCIP